MRTSAARTKPTASTNRYSGKLAGSQSALSGMWKRTCRIFGFQFSVFGFRFSVFPILNADDEKLNTERQEPINREPKTENRKPKTGTHDWAVVAGVEPLSLVCFRRRLARLAVRHDGSAALQHRAPAGHPHGANQRKRPCSQRWRGPRI